MKSKLTTIIIIVSCLILLLAGCGRQTASSVDHVLEGVRSFIKGDVTGELNKSYSTQWFDFTIKSIKTAYSYAGYENNEGYKYVVVAISETNTFDEPIPMGTFDFYLTAEGLSEEDGLPYEPFDDRMMPSEFELAVGESVDYDLVFEIPDEIIDISFVYIELDEEENVGATFTIKHSL